jgi:hypothetical protein
MTTHEPAHQPEQPEPDVHALGQLDPLDLFAIADAARSEAELRVFGARLRADVERGVANAFPYERADVEAVAAAFLAAWDQHVASERERYGLPRLIRQRGLIP